MSFNTKMSTTDQTAARQANNANSKQGKEKSKDIETVTLNIPKYVREKERVLGKKQLKVCNISHEFEW